MSRSRRLALAQWAGIIAVLVAVAFALVGVRLQDQRIDVLSQALTDEQSNAEAQGVEPVAPDPEDLLEDPEYEPQPGPSGPPGPPGPGLSDPEIQAQFAKYFEAHPYEFQPTAAELTAAFAAVLADNPDLLNDQLYSAMAAYLAENPPPAGAPGEDGTDGKDGADGAQGDPGPAPTGPEIKAQIEAYIAENPLPMCPEGTAPEAREVVVVDGPPLELVGCFKTESTE